MRRGHRRASPRLALVCALGLLAASCHRRPTPPPYPDDAQELRLILEERDKEIEELTELLWDCASTLGELTACQ